MFTVSNQNGNFFEQPNNSSLIRDLLDTCVYVYYQLTYQAYATMASVHQFSLVLTSCPEVFVKYYFLQMIPVKLVAIFIQPLRFMGNSSMLR